MGRERKGLSVSQVAERLHVDPHVVEHLESENFGPLGASVYVRGHIRRFAELIGEHPTELQNLYRALTPPSEPDLRRGFSRPGQHDEASKFLVPALYGVVAFLVIGAFWWLASMSGTATPTSVDANPRRHPAALAAARHSRSTAAASSAASEEGTPNSAAEGQVAVASAAGDAQSAAPASTSAPGPAAAPALAASAPPAPAPEEPAAGAPLREADAGSVDASSSKAASSSASSSSASSPPGDTQLTLRFNSDSWTEVYDATGRQVFADVGSQGSVRTFRIKPPVKINLGNGPGVGVEVNGHHAVIDNTVRGDGSAQFTVLKDGRVVKH